MKKFFKYGVVPVVVGTLLLVATVMLLPVLINVQKFLPQIEKQVTQATGRSFSVGSDFGLTFFPWLSVTFSDMRLGSPEAIAADDFIQIDSFEARVKLLPLLAGRYEFSRFVVSGLNINLQRGEDGGNNWDMSPEKKPADTGDRGSPWVSALFSEEFFVELFAITGGSITWNDRQQGSDHQIDELMILANNISSTGSGTVDFKARTDTGEITGAGGVGPFSSNPASVVIDLSLQLGKQLQAIVEGTCSLPVKGAQCDLDVKIPSFSLADLCTEPGAEKSDKKAVVFVGGQAIELGGHFLGNHKKYSVNKGSGTIDGQSFTYQLRHDASQQETNEVELNFNSVNLDRYFTAEKNNEDVRGDVTCEVLKAFKNMPLTGKIKAKELVLADIHFGGVSMDMSGQKGTLSITDGEFSLHGGKGHFTATAGLSDRPVSLESRIEMERVEAASFSKQLVGFPFLSGLVKADMTLKRSELPGTEIGKGFTGHGRIELAEGAITGIHLLRADAAADGKKTEFTRLSTDIIMESGIVRLQPLTLAGAEGITEMRAVVQLEDKSFRIVSDGDAVRGEVVSLAGSYGPDGLTVDRFTDVHEAKVRLGDAQPPIADTVPKSTNINLENMAGTPHIDTGIVGQKSDIQLQQIFRDKDKKPYTMVKGRVRIHPLQELDSPAFVD